MALPDTAYNERNRAQTERLASLRRLSDDEFALPLGEHWTIGVALAHMQYWDTRALGAFEAWRRHGASLLFWQTSEGIAVNDLRLELWRAVPTREALEQAIITAQALDRVIAALTPAEAETVATLRYASLERALHRDGHLSEIEEILPR